jgi:virginiamycin B lyase
MAARPRPGCRPARGRAGTGVAPFPLLRVLGLLTGVLLLAAPAPADNLDGRLVDAVGAAVVGAQVTAVRLAPSPTPGPAPPDLAEPARHAITVFSGDDGRFAVPVPDGTGRLELRVRRIGFRDLSVADAATARLDPLPLAPEHDAAALAAQLPANRWYALLLARVGDPAQREELVRQCTYCHQQGSTATRAARSATDWDRVLMLMGRMGGIVSPALRQRIPALFAAAYDPATAVPALTAGRDAAGFAPPPSASVRRARIDEWTLGGRASMLHDLVVHPDGRIYAVDMTQDRLLRLDPSAPDGARRSWAIPSDDLPPGGAFATGGPPLPPGSQARVGPHSLQVAPDGSIWITLALGNRLARFDPRSESFSIHVLRDGYYPHTLRFDARGRMWFTLAASNQVGVYDPATGEEHEVRLPTRTFRSELAMRLLPLFLWLGRRVDLRGAAAESGIVDAPVPYGIDVAPDGGVWFSQLNDARIGRVDPDTLAVEMVDTPFPGPRRLRFDGAGQLWIPSFSGGLVARFDPRTRTFESFPLPAAGDVPYALNVDRRTGAVWICGANSDSLMRLDPVSRRFTVYPLPTRVTYTREVDFDAEGRPWTSDSNTPARQIEDGLPRLIRLDPGAGDPPPSAR